jgi:hypothetical protein
LSVIGSGAIVGLASGYLGPEIGPLVAVAVAGLIGSLVSMGDADTGGRLGAAVFHLLKFTALACVVSGTVAAALSGAVGVPAVELVLVAAAGVGLIGHRWGLIGASAAGALGALLQHRKEGERNDR